ncbi:MAG: Purine efflux pump PbuE [Candidatus Heimdallarchaeota archaeon LC_3]|nr:MAG: Purine efflux pump PbuE [Candidatus Heimdallarchaeota archaeon LC_3]
MVTYSTPRSTLFFSSISLLLTMSIWFSANAIISQLETLWSLTQTDKAILSSILIIGFVTGGLLFSILNLPDVFKTKNFYVISALLASSTNLLSGLAPNFTIVILTRFLTGFFLAGVYPVAMKLTISWFRENRGLAVGILLGALTVGSGLPYIFNLTGIPDWRILISLSSIQGFIGALIVFFFVEEGPFIGKKVVFKLSNIKEILKEKPIIYANFGYFGHMWELYAFWVWIPVFLQEVWKNSNGTSDEVGMVYYFSIGMFLVFFSGSIANVLGGGIADKIGRTKFNILALSISGTSSILIGLFINDVVLALVIAIIWGIAIIPDSPQYSTMISELSDPSYLGTALTIQTALGFALTIFSIQLVPIMVELVGWTYAFMFLAIGPIFGIISMLLLRKEPDSVKIALGNK